MTLGNYTAHSAAVPYNPIFSQKTLRFTANRKGLAYVVYKAKHTHHIDLVNLSNIHPCRYESYLQVGTGEILHYKCK